MSIFINELEQVRDHVEQNPDIPRLNSTSMTKNTSPIKNVEHVKTTRELTFGVPGLKSFLQALKEPESLNGDLVLVPKNGPCLKRR